MITLWFHYPLLVPYCYGGVLACARGLGVAVRQADRPLPVATTESASPGAYGHVHTLCCVLFVRAPFGALLMIRRGHWPGAKPMAVGKDADAHALPHAKVGVRMVGSVDGESFERALPEHLSDELCHRARAAGEQRRLVQPLFSSLRGVVDEDFMLGVSTCQQQQSRQPSIGRCDAAAKASAVFSAET